jgi:hypothetical protein
LCAATGRQSGENFAIVFYTTSQTDYQGTQRPRQYLFVSKERAIELGQKTAFQIDSSRIARLPLTANYFPEMTGHTIPVRGRDPELVTKVEDRLKELVTTGVEITRVDAVGGQRR